MQGFEGGPSSNTDDDASSTNNRNSSRMPTYRMPDRGMSSSDQVGKDDFLYTVFACIFSNYRLTYLKLYPFSRDNTLAQFNLI